MDSSAEMMGKDIIAQELKKLTSKFEEMEGSFRRELNSKVNSMRASL